MGNWNQILNEINGVGRSPDEVRRKYLAELFQVTGRNTLCYYSGWLQKTGDQFASITMITDDDKIGFMSCFHGLDRTLGLDLFVHSPGGFVSATESLIHYTRALFGDNIRVFVPQLAMSGGTILSLIGKEIWMGTHSNLGPIDPHFGGIPAVTLLDEFQQAFEEIKADPAKINVWSPILSRISPTLLTQAKQAIDLSQYVAETTLVQGMCKGSPDKAEKIAKELANVATHKEHERHIHAKALRNMGLCIRDLEDDNTLQEAVLSVHHAFIITLSNTPSAKMIENHEGSAYVRYVPSGS